MQTACHSFVSRPRIETYDGGLGHLVEIVDNLEIAMGGGRSRGELRHLLVRLETYAGNRFAQEEEGQRDGHMVRSDRHAGHHALLLDYLRDLLARFDAKDAAALQRALGFIHVWCEQHLAMHGITRRCRWQTVH